MTLVADSSTEPAVVEERYKSRSVWWMAVALIAVAALIGIGIWMLVRDSATTTETAPFHAIPTDAVGVFGTAECSFSDVGTDPEGGAGLVVVCELELSDPRVSGTERHDRFRFVAESEAGAVWVAEEATITNEQGTWRGTAQAADDGLPSGEAHYVGEGAYEGLEFHYYFGHVDDIVVRGWISGGG